MAKIECPRCHNRFELNFTDSQSFGPKQPIEDFIKEHFTKVEHQIEELHEDHEDIEEEGKEREDLLYKILRFIRGPQVKKEAEDDYFFSKLKKFFKKYQIDKKQLKSFLNLSG